MVNESQRTAFLAPLIRHSLEAIDLIGVGLPPAGAADALAAYAATANVIITNSAGAHAVFGTSNELPDEFLRMTPQGFNPGRQPRPGHPQLGYIYLNVELLNAVAAGQTITLAGGTAPALEVAKVELLHEMNARLYLRRRLPPNQPIGLLGYNQVLDCRTLRYFPTLRTVLDLYQPPGVSTLCDSAVP
jgi:hypothetical protein